MSEAVLVEALGFKDARFDPLPDPAARYLLFHQFLLFLHSARDSQKYTRIRSPAGGTPYLVPRKSRPGPDRLSQLPCRTMRPGTDQSPPRRLLTVHEAADHLGLTVEAVRSRIKRGTLDKEKDPDGTVYVVVEDGAGDRARPGVDQSTDQATAQPLIVTRLENEVEWLRREVERKDTIIMSLSQSIASLEAPREPSES